MVYRKITYRKWGATGPTTVTRWVDTDSSWWIYPHLETRIKIESDKILGGKREVHEVAVSHDSGTSVSVETKPLREWERTATTSSISSTTTRRSLTWKK